MSDPFVAEIRIFAGNYAPRNWAFCDGELLPIAQFTALFSLIGTTYGGDGRVTMGLPDLEGRAPMHPGTGPGLTPRALGQKGGDKEATLNVNQVPPHTHTLQVSAEQAATSAPGNQYFAVTGEDSYGTRGAQLSMDSAMFEATGGTQPHNNRQPWLALNFIIALQGVFPTRT